MQYITTVLGAALACGAVLLAEKSSPESEMGKQKRLLILLGATALGGLCGWLAAQRVEDWTVMFRLLVITAVLAGASWCDLDRCRIPNLYPAILLGATGVSTLALALRGGEAWPALLGGLLGGGVMLAALCLLRLLSRGGIGFGDIKLLSGIGLLLGLYGAFGVLLFGQIAAVLCALVLLAMKKITMKGSLPFAPFFYFGFAVTLWMGTF